MVTCRCAEGIQWNKIRRSAFLFIIVYVALLIAALWFAESSHGKYITFKVECESTGGIVLWDAQHSTICTRIRSGGMLQL